MPFFVYPVVLIFKISKSFPIGEWIEIVWCFNIEYRLSLSSKSRILKTLVKFVLLTISYW